MSKKAKLAISWIPVLVVVLGGIGYLIKKRLELPPAIVSLLQTARPGVLVVLDNGKQEQTADDLTGFFRFGPVDFGVHNLRFQCEGFKRHAILVHVTEPGDNVITDQIVLQRASGPAPEGEPPKQARTVIVPSRTADGGEANVPPGLLNQLVATTSRSVPPSGWILVGRFSELGWQEPVARVTAELPSRGQTLTLSKDVPVRGKAPEHEWFRGYQLGSLRGVLAAGSSVRVKSIESGIGQDHVWAEVQVVKQSGG